MDQRGTLMDLNMLVLSGGRERTGAEFKELYESAGLTLRERYPTPSGLNLINGVHDP